MRTDGTLIRPAARSFARSWHSGSGTCGWNWGRSFPRPNCARRNLLKPISASLNHSLSRFPLSILHAQRSKRHQFNMVRPNGHALRLREAFLAQLLPSNRMGRCVVLLIARYIPKKGVPSAMVPCESCMLRASVIAALVPYVHSVKKALKAANLGGSVRCCGRSPFLPRIPALLVLVNKAKSGQVLRRGVITQREA